MFPFSWSSLLWYDFSDMYLLFDMIMLFDLMLDDYGSDIFVLLLLYQIISFIDVDLLCFLNRWCFVADLCFCIVAVYHNVVYNDRAFNNKLKIRPNLTTSQAEVWKQGLLQAIGQTCANQLHNKLGQAWIISTLLTSHEIK